MENYLEEILIDYVSFIEGYKNFIQNQDKTEDYYMHLNKGKIGEYNFFYHGAGCRLERNGVVCEFDFLPENDFPIKFSSWKIYEFINTNDKWNKFNFSMEDIHSGLLELVEKGKLVFLEIDGVKLPIFQIKETKSFDDKSLNS